MNDKLSSLVMAEIAAIFVTEKQYPEISREIEMSLKKICITSNMSNMLQTDTERTRNYYIENNLLYSKYNDMC